MKPSALLFVLITLLSTAFYFPGKKTSAPTGMVQLNDTLWMDAHEVSNRSWREYVNGCRQTYGEGSLEYKNALPDTSVWSKVFPAESPYPAEYNIVPKMNEHPVVGISFEQAEDYCRWKTGKLQKAGTPEKFRCRLPGKAEWELAASAGNSEKSEKILHSKNGRVLKKPTSSATLSFTKPAM
jgi:formylglycine-generating enzyme required for sulfatase activity